MADHAAEHPMPTKVPPTLNVSAKEFACTWCPTGLKPSATELEKRRDYLRWKKSLEEEAAKEVTENYEQYKKDRDRKQRETAPRNAEGKSLW